MPSRAMRASVAGLSALILTVITLALLLLLSGRVGGEGGAPAPAAAGCGGSLGAEAIVVSSFPKPFALQYRRKLPLRVTLRRGSARKWRVELYTFSGFLLGKSKYDKRLRGTERTKLKLRQGLQPGPYTLVIKGRVGGCGEKETSQVLRFKDCLDKLPVKFIDKPGGQASDYNSGGFVSAKIAPRSSWSPVRNVRSTLASFEGVVYGRAELPRGSRKLIGEQYLDNELIRNLEPGKYSLYVEGKAPQPRSCGEVARSTVLRFK